MGGLSSLFFTEKFARMSREAMDICLLVLKESNNSSSTEFDIFSVRNSVWSISHNI